MTLESRSITCVADDEVVAVDDWAESSASGVRAGVPPGSVVRVAVGTYDQREVLRHCVRAESVKGLFWDCLGYVHIDGR